MSKLSPNFVNFLSFSRRNYSTFLQNYKFFKELHQGSNASNKKRAACSIHNCSLKPIMSFAIFTVVIDVHVEKKESSDDNSGVSYRLKL